MTLNGYRKQWRKIWDNPVISKNPNRLSVWTWVLDHAMWEDGVKVQFGGKVVELKKGQLTCGEYQIATDTGVSRATVHRVLKLLESEQQIEHQTDRQCSLITVKNWHQYQISEQQNEQRMSKERTTSEQRVNTKEEDKETKEDKNIYGDVDFLLSEYERMSDRKVILRTPKRNTQLKSIMKTFPVEDIRRAWAQMSVDKFLRGQNDRSVDYFTIDYALRIDRIEKYLLDYRSSHAA